MSPQSLGQIKVERNPDGSIGLRQNWDPSQMTLREMQIIGRNLEEVGLNMQVSQFEDQGCYKQFDAAE